ncbi:MAG: 23S rRNA (adenine(2503)-C(2))-methyltransferase RlmN [Eubacteriales bacterium]|nr:23S rRNA (adenine(2503)-C(2))-methyltransferase RlmN [Eubacteriales bacterium]
MHPADSNFPAPASVDLKSMEIEELQALMREKNLPAFRAKQLFEWIHARRVRSYEEMTNLPAALRGELARDYPLPVAELADRQISRVDGTRKYLFRMPDGCLVESVFMRYRFGNSVCVSSQVGCRMGCRFCASTLRGLTRSLAPSEMLEQVYAISGETGERVSHVVVMGMGEPLDNYENLVRFLRLLTCPEGMNLSQRNVTVSTCGIAPNIYRLAGEGLHVTLALSLHAATDEQRRKIMPVAERWPIAELMKACEAYYRQTGRQITFEYSLIRGVNDSREDARGLAGLALPLRAHINLIPVNPVRERGFAHPDSGHIAAFKKELENHGVNVSIRRALGKDIDGACGQLRSRYTSGAGN